MTDALSRLRSRLAAPVDGASIAAFRIVFGLVVVVSVLRAWAYGWLHDFYVAPSYLFKYWGFSWVPAPTADGMTVLAFAIAGLAAMVAAGFLYRITTVLLAGCFAWLQLLDVSYYLNHYYLVGLLALLLVFLPAHRTFSVDAWLRPSLRSETAPAGHLWLLRFQVGVVYVFAGLAKLNADWLLHAQPLSIWLSARTETPLIGPLLGHPAAWYFMSWAGFLFDTTIVAFLSWSRTRPFAYAVVLVFHAATWLLFPIGMFPVIMVTSALIFFSPDWPRRLLRLPAPAAADLGRTFRLRPALFAAALAYCALQVAMPLRAHFYGGNVHWHEQGMRLSWRVMVREKNGSVTYRVRSRATGRTWLVSPHRYLTDHQAREMSGQPDLILQLAHRIADDFRRDGHGEVEVYADVLVSLNGRPASRLIDPDVDLAKVHDGVRPAAWILPTPQDPPVHLRGRV